MIQENKNGVPALQAEGKKKFPFWIGAVVIIFSFIVGAHFLVSCEPSESLKSRERVKLGISQSFFSSAVYIAKAQGFFEQEGLDVSVTEYDSGKMATKGLFAGEVEISTVADMPVVFNSFQRKDFCIFATFTHSYPFVKLIARKDRGIKTGEDLKGKRVGANRGTSSHIFLARFLMYHRIAISEVEMIHFKTAELPAALKNDEVDAISVWQPYSQKAIKLLQGNAIELPNPEIYRLTFNFAVMKRFAKEHSEILKRFLRAMDEACTFIIQNRETSQDIIAEKFKLDKDAVRAVCNDLTFDISLNQSLLMSWDTIARWAIQNNFIDTQKLPNYLNFIYLDALEAVKPESITIIR